ncbi:hypothetical protein [Mongoliitalea lutea]|uniref:Uncharacterized protein n=1 Tax=Mongoliitalea lutea TaxID=849756 RepID=A0A8J3CUW2_9BACT|nr:hypothetical protein [Mongoliitalea lutea]GHB32599.1 hypothetical protein GCM10008106_11780 [Mongoliitalea lutea]
MKNKFKFILILFQFFYSSGNSQNLDKKCGVIYFGVDLFNVSSKLWEDKNNGIGLNLEYHHPLIKKIGVDITGNLGYHQLLGCEICLSDWFAKSFTAGFGLSKSLIIDQKYEFLLKVRHSFVGFKRDERELIIDDVVVSRRTNGSNINLLGFEIGYFLPVKIPLVFSYRHEDTTFHRINAISLSYQF